MKVIGWVCAFISVVTAFIAAIYWYRASIVPIVPTWKIEPGESDASRQGWQVGTMMAFSKSGELNKLAARLTGISIILGAIGNFLAAY